MQRALVLFIGLLLSSTCSAREPAQFEFALLGDTPYLSFEEPAFTTMLEALDLEKMSFVIHVGDFKSSATPCSDELFLRRKRQFNDSVHPFIYIPGDNEWTDCPATDKSSNSVERLNKLRELFFSNSYSLGKRKLKLRRQSSAYPENVRWHLHDIVFVGLNITGSNNNYIKNADNQEFLLRQEANDAWLKKAFNVAARPQMRGLVILIHANPHFEKDLRSRGGYQQFLANLQDLAAGFPKPILIAHGDTHLFRVDQPLKDKQGNILQHVTRVEVPGSPFTDWVRVTVDNNNPPRFTIDSTFDYLF